MKTCFYEILGLEKNCTDEEIKKNYRKKALIWHPDKNPDNQEEATKMFQLITEANEILSNPQERAWYDSHKEQILRGEEDTGGDGQRGSRRLNIWKYFSRSAWSDFSDNVGGFFEVYRSVFAELDEEEEELQAHDDEGVYDPAPSFGDSQTDSEDVLRFYSYWSNFVSRRSFAYADKWKLSAAENRQIRRAMENENKKERVAARKELVEAVRNLCEFCRHRDPRVVEAKRKAAANLAEKKAKEAEAQKLKEAEKRRARQKAREEELLRLAESLEEAGIREESSSEEEAFHCAACNKSFKSEKAYQNHENSKKHKLAVQKLREELLFDEEMLLPEEANAVPIPNHEELGEDEKSTALLKEEVENYGRSKKSKKNKKRQKNLLQTPEVSDIECSPRSSKSLKKEENGTGAEEEDSEAENDGQPSVEAAPKQRRRRRRAKEERDQGTTEDTAHSCGVCGNKFPSKTKLFSHIKEKGHAAPKVDIDSGKRGRRK